MEWLEGLPCLLYTSPSPRGALHNIFGKPPCQPGKVWDPNHIKRWIRYLSCWQKTILGWRDNCKSLSGIASKPLAVLMGSQGRAIFGMTAISGMRESINSTLLRKAPRGDKADWTTPLEFKSHFLRWGPIDQIRKMLIDGFIFGNLNWFGRLFKF